MVTFIRHTARVAGGPPANSLQALGECLRRRVPVAEIDVAPLADADYLVAHDNRLELFSTGRGPVSQATTAETRDLFLVRRGQVTAERPALLSDAVELIARLGGETLVQLDLKADGDVPASAMPALVALVAPIRVRVLVSSAADARLRELRALAPWLRLGFDPMYHLDVRQHLLPGIGRVPRFRGLPGYSGDSPAAPDDTRDDYLRDRFADLLTLAPGAEVWFVRAELLLSSADDGFDWAEALHREGIRLDAWTIDPTGPAALAAARRLAELGVDYITTNAAEKLGELLSG